MTRIEKDPLGFKKVPSNAYFGIHTTRASENFMISNQKMPQSLVNAITKIKIAAAQANCQLGTLNEKESSSIIRAAREILAGKHNQEFILDAFQAGAGTATHMNVNEVIANRANELLGGRKGTYKFIHPNDHVNISQSTNDVFPAAINLATLDSIEAMILELKTTIKTLSTLASKFKLIRKSGRTHLRDAVPTTLGAEFAAYSAILNKDVDSLIQNSKSLLEIHLGGTAIGTGINAHPRFGETVIRNLRKITQKSLIPAINKIESTQNRTPLLILSGSLKALAVDLNKIGNDLRLLSSGPHTGLSEISIPAVEPGSSIMPGKVNPSIIECLHMICYNVIGNDTTITHAVQAAQLELNVMMPVIATSLLESIQLLTNGLKMFEKRCLRGLKANQKQCEFYFSRSMGLATLLNPIIGYEAAAEIAQSAEKKGVSIIDELKQRNILTASEIKSLFSPAVILSSEKAYKIQNDISKRLKKKL